MASEMVDLEELIKKQHAVASSINARNIEIEKAEERLKKVRSDLDTALRVHNESRQGMDEEKARLSDKLASMRKSVQWLEDDINESRELLDAIGAAAKKKDEDLRKASDELYDVTNKIADTAKLENKILIRIEGLRAEEKDAAARVALSDDARMKIDNCLSGKREDLKAVEGRIAELMEDKEGKKAEISTLKKEAKAVSGDILKKKKKCSLLEDEILKKESEISNAKEGLLVIEDSIAGKRSEFDEMISVQKVVDRKMDALKELYDKAKANGVAVSLLKRVIGE